MEQGHRFYSRDDKPDRMCEICGFMENRHSRINLNQKDLESVWFDEDYGFGHIDINNTKIDETVNIRISPEDFEQANEAREIINKFCESLNKLKRTKI